MSRTVARPSERSLPSLDEVQHFTMENASWALYERFLREIEDRPIRVTYDDGRMEIMAPLELHERPSELIGAMIRALAIECKMSFSSFGSTTYRLREKAKGLEPDKSFYFQNETKTRRRKRLDLRKDPPPDLVVEVDITSRSIDREPIYAALGVPEIWRYDGRKLQCLHLLKDSYQIRKHSLVFPFLEPANLQQFTRMIGRHDEGAILAAFSAWVRKNGWSRP